MSHIVHMRHSSAGAERARRRVRALRRLGGGVRFAVALTIAAFVAGVAGAGPSAAASAALRPFGAKNVTFVGHGWGPAWGLAQWGAFGYAAALHEPYQWILSHYYPGTTPSLLTRAGDARVVKVSIEENAGAPVMVTSSSAFTMLIGARKLHVPAGTVVRSVLAARGAQAGTWTVAEASACDQTAGWKVVARDAPDPLAVPASRAAMAPESELLQLCRADGVIVTYRGSIEAFDYYGPSTGDVHLARTLNLVPLEQYVADVTPTESPSGWGSLPAGSTGGQGEAYGFQELEAQAVAVRTYVLAQIAAGGWYGYADICDDVCQGYTSGAGYENTLTTLAARDTAGRILLLNGLPAPTQYASSSGGYTGGSPAFQPVVDKGDAVCLKGAGPLGCNPWHTWTASVPVTQIEAAFPEVGTLADVKVTSRNSLGAYGGRVLEIEVTGVAGASTTVTGNAWAADFNLSSNWFALTDGPSATAKAPTSRAASAEPPDGAGLRRSPCRSVPGCQPPVGPVGRGRGLPASLA